MTRIEDLVRDSLRQRAEDVEPTPALWREVDRRIARRRRFQVVSWSLAGVAAALAALIVLPGVLGGNGPGDLEIEPGGPRTSGVVPSVAVVAEDGGVSLVDITTGERTALDVIGDGPVVQLAVRTGSTVDDYDIAVVQTPDDGNATLTLVYNRPGRGVVADAAEFGDPDFVPTILWSPNGEHIAYTEPGDDGRVRLVTEPAPEPFDPSSPDSDALDGSLGSGGASELATLEPGDVPLDWTGETDEQGDLSRMLIAPADGGIIGIDIGAGDVASSTFSASPGQQSTRVDGTVALVGSHRSTDVDTSPLYALAPGDDGAPSLFWIGGGTAGMSDAQIVEVPLGALVGDADPDALWLDADQDAALVGEGERAWLLAHDGSGDFAPPVEVSDRATIAAFFDAPRPEPSGEQPTEDAVPTEPEAAEDASGPTPGAEHTTVDPGEVTTGAGPVLPEPILTVSPYELRLVGPDGPETLMALEEERGPRFVSARVRPGSTPEDLTVVALTSDEDRWELWDVRGVEGRMTRSLLAGPYAAGVNSPAGEGVAVFGPVWSPDGAHLAWFEFGTGPATLRTIGWDDGPGTGQPATDNATFALEGLPSQPLIPMEWVEVPGTAGLTQIRGTLLDFTEGWIAIPLEVQGDGALAQPAGGPRVVIEPGPSGLGGDPVGAVAAAGQAGIGLMVRSTFDGAELVLDPYGSSPERIPLPADILPGDGLPEYWVRAIGEGALVGSPNTARAWFVRPDATLARLAGEVVDADVVN
jgi:hypothetical protein